MLQAQKLHKAGRLPASRRETLRGRFNRLQEWAVATYGKQILLAAMRRNNPARYSPPQNPTPPPFLFPSEGEWRFTQPVPFELVPKVDAIRQKALKQGWTDASLYQNRGRLRPPLGSEYGLVCFVQPNDELGAISPKHIEIIHLRGLGL